MKTKHCVQTSARSSASGLHGGTGAGNQRTELWRDLRGCATTRKLVTSWSVPRCVPWCLPSNSHTSGPTSCQKGRISLHNKQAMHAVRDFLLRTGENVNVQKTILQNDLQLKWAKSINICSDWNTRLYQSVLKEQSTRRKIPAVGVVKRTVIPIEMPIFYFLAQSHAITIVGPRHSLRFSFLRYTGKDFRVKKLSLSHSRTTEQVSWWRHFIFQWCDQCTRRLLMVFDDHPVCANWSGIFISFDLISLVLPLKSPLKLPRPNKT